MASAAGSLVLRREDRSIVSPRCRRTVWQAARAHGVERVPSPRDDPSRARRDLRLPPPGDPARRAYLSRGARGSGRPRLAQAAAFERRYAPVDARARGGRASATCPGAASPTRPPAATRCELVVGGRPRWGLARGDRPPGDRAAPSCSAAQPPARRRPKPLARHSLRNARARLRRRPLVPTVATELRKELGVDPLRRDELAARLRGARDRLLRLRAEICLRLDLELGSPLRRLSWRSTGRSTRSDSSSCRRPACPPVGPPSGLDRSVRSRQVALLDGQLE